MHPLFPNIRFPSDIKMVKFRGGNLIESLMGFHHSDLNKERKNGDRG